MQHQINLETLKKPLNFTIYLSKPYRYLALGAICSVIIASFLNSYRLYLIKNLTDAASFYDQGMAASSDIWFWFAGYLIAYAINSATWRISGFFGMRFFTKLEASVYSFLFNHLSLHSRAYFSRKFAGALSNKISNAANGLIGFFSTCQWEITGLFITLIVNFVLVAIFSTKLALIMLAWVIVFFTISFLLIRYSYRFHYDYSEVSSDLRGRIVDSVSNHSEVQNTGNYAFEQEYIYEYIDKFRRSHFKAWGTSELQRVYLAIMVIVFLALMIGGALHLFINKAITLGSVVMIITMALSFGGDLYNLAMHATETIRSYSQAAEGLNELLVNHEIIDAPEAKDLAINKAEVEFKNITFAYDARKVFNNFSLKILGGQKVGLVGVSGAGKSTFVSLLFRQYDLNSGLILIDNQDISKGNIVSLRKNLALVPQDVSLFHRTIRENIRYGNLDASDEEVEKAAKLAQAHEFIIECPQGYETFVGERGIKLSGGQRQRVAIARAFLRNAPILVLDEATSALDSESELAVQKGLKELFSGRTVIAIAHRLSTLLSMDRILVFDNGKVIEDGSHGELLAKSGIYAGLWRTQASGFIIES